MLRELFISQEGNASLTFLQECIPTKTIKQIKAKMKAMNLSAEAVEKPHQGIFKATTVEKLLNSPVKKFDCALLCGATFKSQKLATVHQ